MKSYKDLDKHIILNAPEGAMWYNTGNGAYYKHIEDGIALFTQSGYWIEADGWNTLICIQQEGVGQLIPLPNIEIPWEATEDSKCPVPDGLEVKVFFDDGEDDTDRNPWGWGWTHRSHRRNIVAYKVIAECYLGMFIQDEPIEVDELEMHRAAYQAIKNAGFESPEELLAQHKCLLDKVGDTSEDKLIKRLEFLQNLANKFPEIRDEAIKFMECELDGYMNTLWESEENE